MGKLVSVIIPAYNVKKFIGRCLDSIINQTYPNIEIIVSYSQSSDDTIKVLKTYEGLIKLIIMKKCSPAIARNVALMHANGEYIAFCDGDDFFEPEKVEQQVKVLDENADIGLVYNDYILIDQSGKEINRVQVPCWNRKRWLLKKFDIQTSSIMLIKELLDTIEEDGCYFDEKLVACEDFDLQLRLSRITKFKRVPLFLTYYTRNEGQLSQEIMKTVIMEIKVFIKHKLYFNIMPLITFEIAKMILIKIFKKPMIGFGLLFK